MKSILRSLLLAGVAVAAILALPACNEDRHDTVRTLHETREGEVKEQGEGQQMVNDLDE